MTFDDIGAGLVVGTGAPLLMGAYDAGEMRR
jgi:hypothetical protein